jgi:predicted dehydrogenase
MRSPNFSRRSFLKSTLAAGVAPLFLPSHVWSAETKPNDRLNLAVIGIGKQAGGHLSGFMGNSQTQVVAVCDVDTTRREHGKKQVEAHYAKKTESGTYAGCAATKDFRELLARKDIDGVVIVTPDHWHAPISIAAAAAGKDIYCEKPLCQTVHEARAMVDAVRKHERVFQTGSQQRSSREFRVACELVRNGRLGRIERVTAGFGGPGKACDLPEEPMEAGLDWDLWLGPAPMRPYNSVLSPRGVHNHFPMWRQYWEYGGGMVTDWGAHHIDIAQWGLGVDDSGPVEVLPPDNWKDAKAGAKLRYASGIEVTHIEENGVTFYGSEGVLYVNRGKFKLTMGGVDKGDATVAGAKLGPILDAVEKEFLADAKIKLTASTDHKADWLNAVRTRQRPIADVDIGARTVTSCHLLNFAYRFGQKFQWDPAQNTFTGGTGDAKWLKREYRDAWRVV